MAKVIFNLSEELKNCKISLPATVPVTENFDASKILGQAEVKEENGEVIAEMNIVLPKEKLLHSVGMAGIVTGREENKITGYDIHSVSFISGQPQNDFS